MSKIRVKWLLVIVGIELVIVVSLLLWAVFAPPSRSEPSAAKPTPTVRVLQSPQILPVLIAKGLGVPTAITGTPNPKDTALFVAERRGLIHIIDQGKVSDKLFLDISSKVKDDGEMGLLGFTFHPQFVQNGYFFVNYVDKNQNTVIARYALSPTTGLADPASEKVLLTLKQPFTNHNGGQLAFGPDGYLYIGLGDGGSAGDPNNRAQDKNLFFGKILRIDVDHGDPYAVPADNPFVGQAGVKPEIWAYGLRNPWRFSFDTKNGDLFIADVGQNQYEEINVQSGDSKGGVNYGWRCYEAGHVFNDTGCQDASHYTLPTLEYDHGEHRCSVTGGSVYRGTDYPALLGHYFYGDFCGGQIYTATHSNGKWTPALAQQTKLGITTFGTDSRGELYLGDANEGAIYHLTDSANAVQ